MSDWKIAGKPDGSMPEVDKLYEIRDSRKGTFAGRIIKLLGKEFAEVERLKGRIGWASNENRLFNTPFPAAVGIRDTLCYLRELSEEEENELLDELTKP